MSKIDPRFVAPDYVDALNHKWGGFMDGIFIRAQFNTKESTGAFPPPQWSGDAIAPRPRPLVPTPIDVRVGQPVGNFGEQDYSFNRRGG